MDEITLEKLVEELAAFLEPLAEKLEQLRGDVADVLARLTELERVAGAETEKQTQLQRVNGLAKKAVKGIKFSLIDRLNPSQTAPVGPGTARSPEIAANYFPNGETPEIAARRARYARQRAEQEAKERAERERIREGVAGMFDAGIVQ